MRLEQTLFKQNFINMFKVKNNRCLCLMSLNSV